MFSEQCLQQLVTILSINILRIFKNYVNKYIIFIKSHWVSLILDKKNRILKNYLLSEGFTEHLSRNYIMIRYVRLENFVNTENYKYNTI